ncbi:MAG TPA: gliding motility-associated ABC transporter substrate-binding protein GldG [Bacteroidales bacterium]
MKKKELKRQHVIQLILSLIILILAVFISSKVFFRIDLTSEKRFTLSSETKTILKDLDDVVYVKVYLDGDLPVGFKKLRNVIRETLDEFRVYGKSNVQYEFINPSESSDIKVRRNIYSDLVNKGVQVTNIQSHDKEGGESEKIIFPGALISYKGNELPVALLKNNVTLSAEENLNNSMQTVEYSLIKGIYDLTNKNILKIGFLEGQGELSNMQIADIDRELSNYYRVEPVVINKNLKALDPYKVIVIAKPTKSFDETDKFVIDQYVMNGGKVMWFVDEVNVNADSLTNGSTIGFINDLGIDDQLFTYGVRINPNLVQDIQCNQLPVSAGNVGGQTRWVPAPWLYYPLISPLVDHPITRNLNLVWAKFASQIDTLAVPGIRKIPLLKTSTFTRLVKAPLFIRLSEVKEGINRSEFNKPNQTISILLEGRFPSLFRNRQAKDILPGDDIVLKKLSVPTKMIVVADGDLIANDVRISAKGPMITPLGFDKYSRQTFGNKEFIVNCIDYLTDESGLMALRAKEFKLRILDKARIRDERFKWQMINTVLPVFIVIAFGFYYNASRKKKYAK